MTPPDEAFDLFVRLRGARLLRLATLLAGDLGRGEDLLQSTLEKVYVRWAKGPPPDEPYAYVRAALVHAAQRSWRHRRRGPEMLVGEVATADRGVGADVGLLRGSLLDALADLPARQRAVIALRFFDSYSEVEVAELLGLNLGTVKTHAHRGLRRLRADPRLAGYLDPVRED